MPSAKHEIMITEILDNKRVSIFFLLLIGIWHITSLPFSPLPWFDETFFASITHSLLSGKGFMLEVSQLMTGGNEVLTYGPVYFLFTSLSCSIFGFDIFAFRLVNLIFAALSVFIFFRIQKAIGIKPVIVKIITSLLIFDVIFLQNAHSGRMDLVALFFALLAYLQFFKNDKRIRSFVLMSISGTLGILTTPRIAIILAPVFIIYFIQLIRRQAWKRAGILAVLPIGLYLIWIYIGFGSMESFLSHYIGNSISNNQEVGLLHFLGGNFNIPYFQYPLILVGLVSFLLLLVFRKSRLITLSLFLPISFYYLIVKDTGAYSAMIVPFWYLIISYFIHEFKNDLNSYPYLRYIYYIAILSLFALNAGIFFIKSGVVLLTSEERNPRKLNEWVQKHIEHGTNVVGDDRYYYACKKLNCNFQYIQRPATPDIRSNYHREIFQPDYIFISSQTQPEIIKAYRNAFQFGEEFEYNPESGNSIAKHLVSNLPFNISSSYKGKLIKVKK